MTRLLTSILTLGLILGCASGDPAPAPTATAPTATAPASTEAPVPAAPAPAPAPTEAPARATLSPEQLCADSGLMLTQYSYEALANGEYCKQCGKFDEFACELDWPSSDVPACEMFDLYRNTIMAWHGHVFTKPEYKTWFEKKAWYKADPTFKGQGLSAVETANIALLKAKAEKKQGCEPYPTYMQEMIETD